MLTIDKAKIVQFKEQKTRDIEKGDKVYHFKSQMVKLEFYCKEHSAKKTWKWFNWVGGVPINQELECSGVHIEINTWRAQTGEWKEMFNIYKIDDVQPIMPQVKVEKTQNIDSSFPEQAQYEQEKKEWAEKPTDQTSWITDAKKE